MDMRLPRSRVTLCGVSRVLPSDAHELEASLSPTFEASQEGPSSEEAVILFGAMRLPLVSGRATISDDGAPGLVRSGTTTLGTFDSVLQVWVSSTVFRAK